MEMRRGAGQPLMSITLQAIAAEFQKITALRHRRSEERNTEEGTAQASTRFSCHVLSLLLMSCCKPSFLLHLRRFSLHSLCCTSLLNLACNQFFRHPSSDLSPVLSDSSEHTPSVPCAQIICNLFIRVHILENETSVHSKPSFMG